MENSTVKQEIEPNAGLKSKTKAFYYVIIALLITLGFLGWMLQRTTIKLQQVVQEKVEINNINHFLTDTLKVFKNREGQLVAKAVRLQQNSTKNFLKLENLTGDNKRLQDLVRKNESRLGVNGSVTLLGTTTNINTTVKTDTIVKKDSTLLSGVGGKPDTIKYYPEYRSDFNLGKWVSGTIIANKDSISLKPITILDEYEIVNGEDKVPGTGFLGMGAKTIPYSEVTSLNPYSQAKVVKTFSIKSTIKPKKWVLGPVIGGGVTSEIKIKPFWGLGLMYKLLEF